MTDNFKPSDLIRRDSNRLRRYQEQLDIYQGTQWQGRERPGEKRLTFNYARVIIDKLTSYLMSGAKIVVDPVDDSPEAGQKARYAEQSLQNVSEANALEQLDSETEVDCAVLGDASYKVVWDADQGIVRVSAPDIQGLFLWTRADDINSIWRIASRYSLDSESKSLWIQPGVETMLSSSGRLRIFNSGSMTRCSNKNRILTGIFLSSFSPTCESPSSSGGSPI
jgi:hypothetical protein